VLCRVLPAPLGPLYHLLDRAERVAAWRAAGRADPTLLGASAHVLAVAQHGKGGTATVKIAS
jgi:hypothetical protein